MRLDLNEIIPEIDQTPEMERVLYEVNEALRLLNDFHRGKDSRFLNIGVAREIAITSGVATASGSHCKVTVESGATDDLDTLNGGKDGDVVVLKATDTTKTVVCKDGTGNLKLAGDFSLDNIEDRIVLHYDGSNWHELARSDNGA